MKKEKIFFVLHNIIYVILFDAKIYIYIYVPNCTAIPRGSNNASLLTSHVTDETRSGDNCYITQLRIQLDRVI